MGTNKSKKEKRFQKFVEKQVKKEERAALLEKLSASTWKSALLRSSKTLGRQTEAKREKLHRAALEEKLGLARSDPSVRLYVPGRDPDEVSQPPRSLITSQPTADSEEQKQQQQTEQRKRKRNKKSKRGDSVENGDGSGSVDDDAAIINEGIECKTGDYESKMPTTDSSALQKRQQGAQLELSNKRPIGEVAAGGALATTTIVKRKRQKKGHVLQKLGLSKQQTESSDGEVVDENVLVINGKERKDNQAADNTVETGSEFDSSASESEAQADDDSEQAGGDCSDTDSPMSEQQAGSADVQSEAPNNEDKLQIDRNKVYYTGSMLKPLLVQRGAIGSKDGNEAGQKAYYVWVERPEHIREQRAKLPVYAEEQQIMEAITENPVLVLSGETGSGKTTQVPQFLFEAGYGDPKSANPGMIGITQPRRVAALSMASRVAEELGNFGHTVAHQVRFDATVSDSTRVKFMTEGVLLRELANDLLLTKYSVVIIDEAHERSLNTDILLGVLSRVVRLREKLSLETPEKHRPLKLVIMSATLRVDDFVKNQRLFAVPPPVISVQARQHAVRVHFNRRTPAPGEHLSEAIKKVGKIHQRLPDGGILVFLTGQAEITYVCKKLKEQFPTEEEREARKRKQQQQQQRRGGADSRQRKQQSRDRQGACRPGSNAESAVNGLETSVENEDVDIGSYDLFAEDGELQDDFDFESESDSEEESEIILGGDGDEDARRLLLGENLNVPLAAAAASAYASVAAGRQGSSSGIDAKHPPPLHVLPLYSLLPAEQQLRVFAPPPAGSRLCVVATNVAETSITIPGIRYVVDTGLAKEKTYDPQTQVQSFAVGWASQASANQRMGRAGRTGPGHCYRIFSSAVFNDQFARFSEPEIMRMPIEGVVLQMKAMCLDNVVNFPFPMPPSRSALAKAERLLAWLGALDDRGRITDLGRLMSVFPVAPRFSKMLIVGQQHGCLPYIIAIVAGLSVGDPFVKEFNLDADGGDGTGADGSALSFEDEVAAREAENLTSEALAAKEAMRIERRKYWAAQAKLAGADPTSDVLKWLTAIGAFEYAGGTQAACVEYYVRMKAMSEIRKLRGQLTTLVQMYCPGVDIAMDPLMPPPTKLQQSVIRQIVLAGFLDQVAVRGDIAGVHTDDEAAVQRRGMHATPYVTMWSDEPVFIHPESVVYAAARAAGSMPQAIVFAELQRTTRLWAKAVTVVNTKWLATVGQPLCTFGNPLPYPLPKYNEARDQMVCYVEPRFGPKAWALSMVKVEERRTGTRWQITKVIG
ncbi:putative ATP-dependent RNA helicase DHR1 [Coemansia spiralis]|uniref:RNA helicase n=1 Tax=Coemansia spiralis TaxID=417178 RepID=A0A9W8KZ00_9FUNG|nr:putative ATP-dependent RNA helicase DHR1 [Coemansia spiralis]